MSPREPLILISCDGHIGPTLPQMRPYCPSELLDEYDAFTRDMGPRFDIWADTRARLAELEDREFAAAMEHEIDRNLQTAGHHDVNVRLADMDGEGIAADVIYHSSQNGQPIPFIVGGSLFFNPTGKDLHLAAAGTHIYNRWLADACSVAPERLVGVAHLPAWDIEASIAEVEWAASAGLRAVNLPSPRDGIAVYDNPAWEPFWATCADLGITLNTHVGGAGGVIEMNGKHSHAMLFIERSGWLSRRGLPRMLFSGVFERYPKLTYVLTEQNGEWWTATMREYDSAYYTHRWQIKDQMPKPPSEYCATNVYIGGSYMAPFEARMAVDDGYVANLMWGADYPHAEGTYQYPVEGEPNMTHTALRYTFHDIGPDDTKLMLSDNALRCYGFDAKALRPIANRINSPTLEELSTPPEAIPELTASMAFRTIGPFG